MLMRRLLTEWYIPAAEHQCASHVHGFKTRLIYVGLFRVLRLSSHLAISLFANTIAAMNCWMQGR